jgi:hypothetical protein
LLLSAVRIEKTLVSVNDVTYELRVFEERMSKTSFVCLGEEVTQRWRNVHTEIFIALILKQILFHHLNQNE